MGVFWLVGGGSIIALHRRRRRFISLSGALKARNPGCPVANSASSVSFSCGRLLPPRVSDDARPRRSINVNWHSRTERRKKNKKGKNEFPVRPAAGQRAAVELHDRRRFSAIDDDDRLFLFLCITGAGERRGVAVSRNCRGQTPLVTDWILPLLLRSDILFLNESFLFFLFGK